MVRPLPLRRRATRVGALLLAALALTACADEGTTRRRSVILISLDTLRADHLSLYGYERETTPYLEELAAESLVCDQAYSTVAWTLPAHVTMLTGLYPTEHGVVKKDLALSPEIPMLAERLEDLGYRTAALYFESWIHARHGFDRGFDTFRPHADGAEAEEHLEALALEPGRPLFLFVHLFDAHTAPFAPGGDLYATPAPYDELWVRDAKRILGEVDAETAWSTPGLLTAEQSEAMVALYDGAIRYVDELVRGWVESWEASGLLDDALLIVTSDHGESLGLRDGDLGGHGGIFQEGLRVPLLVRHPDGVGAGQRLPHAVSLVDLVPTVLDFLGLPADPALPGASLFAPPTPEETALAQRQALEVAVQMPSKVVMKFDHQAPQGERQQFYRYDLVRDPNEENPIPITVDDFRRVREAVPGVPIVFDPPSGDPTRRAIQAAARTEGAHDMLQALGYAGELEDE